MPWEDIASDPEFQAQPYDVRQRVANNYFDANLADPDFHAAPEDVQAQARSGFLNHAAITTATLRPRTPIAPASPDDFLDKFMPVSEAVGDTLRQVGGGVVRTAGAILRAPVDAIRNELDVGQQARFLAKQTGTENQNRDLQNVPTPYVPDPGRYIQGKGQNLIDTSQSTGLGKRFGPAVGALLPFVATGGAATSLLPEEASAVLSSAVGVGVPSALAAPEGERFSAGAKGAVLGAGLGLAGRILPQAGITGQIANRGVAAGVFGGQSALEGDQGSDVAANALLGASLGGPHGEEGTPADFPTEALPRNANVLPRIRPEPNALGDPLQRPAFKREIPNPFATQEEPTNGKSNVQTAPGRQSPEQEPNGPDAGPERGGEPAQEQRNAGGLQRPEETGGEQAGQGVDERPILARQPLSADMFARLRGDVAPEPALEQPTNPVASPEPVKATPAPPNTSEAQNAPSDPVAKLMAIQNAAGPAHARIPGAPYGDAAGVHLAFDPTVSNADLLKTYADLPARKAAAADAVKAARASGDQDAIKAATAEFSTVGSAKQGLENTLRVRGLADEAGLPPGDASGGMESYMKQTGMSSPEFTQKMQDIRQRMSRRGATTAQEPTNESSSKSETGPLHGHGEQPQRTGEAQGGGQEVASGQRGQGVRPQAGGETARPQGEVGKEPWQMTLAEVRDHEQGRIDNLKGSLADAPETSIIMRNPSRDKLTKSIIRDAQKRIKSGEIEALHRKSVEKALEEGKPVPREVLADYPDLAKQAVGEIPGDVVKAKVGKSEAPRNVPDATDAEADAARKRIAAKARGGTLRTGPVDPEDIADYAAIGAQWIRKGYRDLKAWSDKMISDIGEHIRPHLQAIWERARGIRNSMWYSKMRDTLLSKLPGSGTAETLAQQIMGMARKGEFKSAELEESGLLPWLAEQNGKVTAKDVLDRLDENAIELREVTLGKNKSYPGLWLAENGEVKPYAGETINGIDSIAIKANNKEHAARISKSYDETARYNPAQVFRDEEDIPGHKPTKHNLPDRVLPGGENYREVLLTLPDFGKRYRELTTYDKGRKQYLEYHEMGGLDDAEKKELSELRAGKKSESVNFKSSHFDEPNILAHVRLNDRTSPDGKKTLFVEEVQSDWHQKGRKEGYYSGQKYVPEQRMVSLQNIKTGDQYDGGRAMSVNEADQIMSANPTIYTTIERRPTPAWFKNGVPDAPFKKNWHELAMKRVLRMAADEGYDRVAWTTGEQQAERYDLSKQVDSVSAFRNDDGTFNLRAKQPGTETPIDIGNNVQAVNLPDIIGKELAAKIADQPPGLQRYAGHDLKVGGEGMKGFYDKILPSAVNDIGKKMGLGKVGTSEIGKKGGESPYRYVEGKREENSAHSVMAHSIDLTPAARAKISGEPMTLYSGLPLKPAIEGAKQIGDWLSRHAEAATERIREKFTGNRLNSGIDPQDLADLAIIGAQKLRAGYRTFKAWSSEMIDHLNGLSDGLGAIVEKHFPKIWAAAHDLHEEYGGKPMDRTVPAAGGAEGEAQTEGEPEKTTSIKNAATDAEREARGMPPAIQAALKTLGKSNDEGAAILADNPNAGRELVEELNSHPRPITDAEVAVLTRHQADVTRRADQAAQNVIDARASGNDAKRVEAQVRSASLSDDLLNIFNADRKAGTETARGLNARRMALKEDYSLARMETRKRAAVGGRELTPREQYELQAAQARIASLEKQVEAHATKISDLEARRAANVSKAPTYGARNRLVTRDQAHAAREELRAAMSRLNVGLDPALAAALAKLGLFHLEAGAREFGAWSAAMVSDLGEKIRPHLNDAWDDAKGQFDAAHQKKGEASRLKGFKTRTTKRIEELEAKTAASDFAPPPPRKPLQLDAEAMRLKANADRAKSDFERALTRDRLANRTTPEKIQDAFVRWRRAFILSGPSVLAKLSSAAAQRMMSTPLEELAGSVIGKVIPGISERAPRQGGLNVSAEAKAITEGVTAGMADSLRTLKTGRSDLDVLYDKENKIPSTVADFFGHLHGALKAPVKRAEFARSFEKRAQFALNNGLDPTDPATQAQIGIAAYKDANRAIFMQDNRVVNAYKRALQALEQPDKLTGRTPASSKALGTMARTLLPIVKIPTNIVAETIENATGLVTGSARVARAYRAGIENLKPDEADVIMRQLKKGSLGAAVLALGYFGADQIGGYYQQNEKRKPGDVQAGAARIFGVNIPPMLLHNPLMECLQIGATVRRIAEHRPRKTSYETEGTAAGIGKAVLGLIEEVPFVGETLDASKLYGPNPGGYVGNEVRSLVVPQAVQWAAQQTDKDSDGNVIGRKPETLGQSIAVGIPGLRSGVQTKEQAASKTRARASLARGY